MKYILFLVGLVWVLIMPNSSYAQTSRLIDGDGFTWEISQNSNDVLQIKNDPLIFEPGLILEFASNSTFSYTNFDFEINGRQYVAGPTNAFNAIEITRKIYVPNTEGWIRVVDRYDNLTSSPISNLRINTDSRFQGYSTNSTSDNSSTPDWAILTNSNPAKPVVSLHLNGTTSNIEFTLNEASGPTINQYDVTSSIDIPANGSIYIMYFASLSNDLQSAQSKANALIDPLPAEALFGLKINELNGIINWDVSSNCAPPVVSFFSSGGCTDESIQFIDNSDIDPQDQSLYTYEWSFGDGTILEGDLNTTHIYENPGTYNVTLKLIEIGNEACFGISQQQVEVTDKIDITIADNIVVCESEGLVDLKQFISHEGEIIGSFNNLDTYPITENGILDPALAGPGEFFFEYSLGDLNSCVSSAIGSGIIEASGEIGFVDLQPLTLNNDPGKCEVFYNAEPPAFNSGCREGLEVIGNTEPGILSVGTHIVIWSIVDGDEVITSESQEIEVIDIESPLVQSEAQITIPVNAGSCTFNLSNEALVATDNCNIGSITFEVEETESNELEPGDYSVLWVVTDESGNSTEFNQVINVINIDGDIQNLSIPNESMVNENINLSATYNGNEIAQASVDWGDGTSSEANVDGNSISSSYSYGSQGSFTGSLIVVDICGVETASSFDINILENNDGEEFFGIVSGGGWFNSLKGNYIDDPDSEGRSIFGVFVLNSSTKNQPRGSVFFYYTGSRLQFRGRTIQSVETRNGDELLITARGKINRKTKGTIEILIKQDGSSISKGHKVLVKVYNSELNTLVYDNSITNEQGTEFAGRIRIREEEQKSRNSITADKGANLLAEVASWSVYPNPAVNEINILPENTSFESVYYQVYDLRGTLLIDKQAGYEANYSPTRISVDILNPGSYILNVIDQSGEILNSQRFVKQ